MKRITEYRNKNNGFNDQHSGNICIRYLLIAAMIFTQLLSNAQSGKITGTIIERGIPGGVPDAMVKLLQNGVNKIIVKTDSNGYFAISPLDPGLYDLNITYFDYKPVIYKDIIVESKTNDLGDIIISSSNAIPIIIYGSKSFNKKTTVVEKIVDHEQIMQQPVTNIFEIVAHGPGVQSFGNGRIAIKGDATGIRYLLDGVPVNGNPDIPRSSIDNFEMITGGIPSEYGDFTGAVINITTINPTLKPAGRIECLSSQFLDPFGNNLIEGSFSGGIIKNKKDTGKSILGFAVSGNYSHNEVSNPSPVDLYRVNDDILSEIKNNPVVPSPLGQGVVSSASFITLNDMRKTRVEDNTASGSFSLAGKLVFDPAGNINITLGGSMDQVKRNVFYYPFTLFNAENNPQVLDNNSRAFVKFRQRFVSDEKAGIKDIWYTFEMGYNNHNSTVQDSRHKDNYFDYGYLGTFSREFTPQYLYDTRVIDGKQQSAYYETIPTETKVTFTPGGTNPVAENYASQFFNLHGGAYKSFTQIQSLGGLVNGQSPALVYSLWSAPGALYPSYQKTEDEQYNFSASATATVNKIHTVKFGFEYDQNIYRSYTVGGNFGTSIQELWTRARQLLNAHLTQFDLDHPIPVYSDGKFTDSVNYKWQISEGAQSTFDKNFRNYLISIGARDENGKLIDDQTIINLDAYKPSDMKLSYFSPDELLNNGHSYVNAYGFDYQGNKLSGKQNISDFLDPMKRSEGAYNPIYMAGYIQDKFELQNINFNIGFRVDRFDANQKVLSDPYSLFPLKTVAEVNTLNGTLITHPGNIGSGYLVYVDDLKNPTQVTGYRNGSTWYDSKGAEIHDPRAIAELSETGIITPYLENPLQKTISTSSFKDYTPQVNILPRISFSFNISDKSSFYANYDVLAVRPTNNFGALDYYYYIDTRSTNIIPNPDLKPEKRINYEIGFRQRTSENSFISLDAYYGEIRDRVQLVKLNYAYPVSYTSYGNIDFGTVKGVSFGFDTWRPKEHQSRGITFSANYTLQFADGTGSGANSAGNLLSAGFPNLRTIFPMDYDTRNQVNATIDYRFGKGAQYAGPISKSGKKWLADAGLNLLLTAKSGNPYTGQANVTPQVEIGVNNRSTIVGTINGERLPWQFKADLKAEKNFHFITAKDKKTELVINAYIMIQNLTDAKNIINVYRATGLPNQDGYLQSPAGKSEAGNAASQQAFIDQYNVKLNDPANYIAPRFIRLGASVNF